MSSFLESKIHGREPQATPFRAILNFRYPHPLVLGIGYAATRDLNSFLRY